MKIMLLKGLSQYDAMRQYIDQWDVCFQKLGQETMLFDVPTGDITEGLKEVLRTWQPDVVISCNAIYAEMIEKAMPEHCLLCTVLYDNPVFHGHRLAALGSQTIVFSCDRFYEEFIRGQYPGLRRVGFLPLSGSQAQTRKPYRERTIELLFTGTYFDINKHYEAIKKLPENLQIIAENIISIMVEEPDTVLWQAMDQVMQSYGVSLDSSGRLELLQLFQCIDIFVRAYVRDQVMLHIVDAGIPVHIFGEGWHKFCCNHPENLILHEGYGDVSLGALADTKVSLNIMPWFRGGIQERNIAAMLAGAVSLTDSSTYIEENFCDGEDIVLYSLKEMDQIPAVIHSVLEDDEKGAAIAEAGYRKAVSGHTWEHRVQEMFAVIKQEMKTMY
ncbi:MAG: glycosyltransferase [Lachnospiraceae bacterium]|nr:glycosyltransferase [Lachnospiraceae bacterium]